MLRKNKNSKKNFWKKLSAILLGVIMLSGLFNTLVNKGVDLISYVVFPVQKSIYNVGNYVKETSDAITKYKKVLEENKRLVAENIKYDRLLAYNEELTSENEKLREILKMKSAKKLDIKVAKINFRNQNNLYQRFFIDLGSDDEIKEDMIVLTEDDKLIGKVEKVYSNYSLVSMITAENSYVSALSSTNMLGIVKGSDEGDGTLYFQPNTFQNTLQIGEKIYTSGISEIYPKGLYVGEITEIDENEDDVFRSIKLKNDVDVINMNRVLILIPKENDKKEKK